MEEVHAPLPIQYADANNSDLSGRPYEFFGYPWRKVHSEKLGGILEPRLYNFRSVSISKTDYTFLGITPQTHIAVKFDLKQVTDENGRIVAAPNPQGMSGGPVWSFAQTDLGGHQMWTPRLVGVAIEFISNKQTLIGVRINAALECIRRISPSLSAYIPTNPSLAIISRDNHE